MWWLLTDWVTIQMVSGISPLPSPTLLDTVLQTGKLDPHYPKVCGHRGNVLDIKWNPFDDFEIASCSEDTMVSVSAWGHSLDQEERD